MAITLEERQIIDAGQKIKARERRVAKAARPKKVVPTAKGQREPRQLDGAYIAWLHVDLPCIGCLIEGPVWSEIVGRPYPIEAAHQKHTDLKGPALGKRPSDSATVPLCAWHHRLAPDACDPAQRKFWDRLQVDVGAFCKALYATFKGHAPGAPVIQKFARGKS